MNRNIFITGGGGYVGSLLVPKLLERGHRVVVLDLFLYGEDVLGSHPNLTLIKGDIRDKALIKSSLPGSEVVIHLACISNDPSFELNPDLGRAINLDAFQPLVECAIASGVVDFIYASSSSVYGVKKDLNVTEDVFLEPLTDYSKYKAQCEEILAKFKSPEFNVVTLRPATVCGYAPRQRLDVVVNILTNLAYHKGEVSIFGGQQLRPNIHIKDMVNAYVRLVEMDLKAISGEIFNVGFENRSVSDLAEIVCSVVGEGVNKVITPTDDNRSYHISSEKIRSVLDFNCEHSIKNAVEDLVFAFRSNLLPDSLTLDKYFNIKRMQTLNLT